MIPKDLRSRAITGVRVVRRSVRGKDADVTSLFADVIPLITGIHPRNKHRHAVVKSRYRWIKGQHRVLEAFLMHARDTIARLPNRVSYVIIVAFGSKTMEIPAFPEAPEPPAHVAEATAASAIAARQK